MKHKNNCMTCVNQPKKKLIHKSMQSFANTKFASNGRTVYRWYFNLQVSASRCVQNPSQFFVFTQAEPVGYETEIGCTCRRRILLMPRTLPFTKSVLQRIHLQRAGLRAISVQMSSYETLKIIIQYIPGLDLSSVDKLCFQNFQAL